MYALFKFDLLKVIYGIGKKILNSAGKFPKAKKAKK